MADMSKYGIPMVTYKLQQPIRSKQFNHKMFADSFDINFLIQDEAILLYHCQNSPFIDPEHGLI